MKVFAKLKKLKSTKGQALLLVMIVSMVTLAIVIGVLDRTNKQLNIQRQNAEYKIAFDRVLSATDTIQAVVNSSTISNRYDSTEIMNAINATSGIIPCNDSSFTDQFSSSTPCEYSIVIDPYNAATVFPTTLSSDQSIFIKPFNAGAVVQSFRVWCDVTNANSAVLLQPIYNSASGPAMDSIATDCKASSSSPGMNNGPDWNAATQVIGGYTQALDGLPVTIGTRSYQKIVYNIPAANQNIIGIRVIPKVGFNNSAVLATSVMLRMYNVSGGNESSSSNIVGSSAPLTGKVTGYAKSARTATISFTIDNSWQVPEFLNYVIFEGNK